MSIRIFKEMDPSPLEKLKEILTQQNQTHILDMFPDLNEDHPIYSQLSRLDIPTSLKYLEEAKSANVSILADSIQAVDGVVVWSDEETSEKQRIIDIGRSAIRDGLTAAVIMSGGQGTRLNYSGPKGMYSIGLPSGKSIFQLHIERILKIRLLCASSADALPSVPIYIMTSDLNDHSIREYFRANNYFGYPAEDVFFFEQGLQPCLDLDGRLIVESRTSLALAPDGNGGLYNALRHSGAFEDITRRGVRYLHVYGIDNVLTKSLDPAFMGLCIDRDVECGNKVAWRLHKSEKVGVTATSNGKMCIVEYSEIPPALAEAEGPHGKLLFGAANLCNHFLSVDFLQSTVFPSLCSSYHLASKKIPFLDARSGTIISPSKPNGVKLEMFIFDVFPLANRWLVMEIDRNDEFAPVKNAPGEASDSPDTARVLMTNLAVRWLREAGATVLPAEPAAAATENDSVFRMAPTAQCEISPLVSYAGEGLEHLAGQVLQLPLSL